MTKKYDFPKLNALAEELEQLINEHGLDHDLVRQFARSRADVPGFKSVAVAIAQRSLERANKRGASRSSVRTVAKGSRETAPEGAT